MFSLLLSLAGLNVLMLALEIPRHGGLGPNWFALEALLLTGLFALLPVRRWSAGLAWLAGLLFMLLAMLSMADALARYSLGRPLNIYLDLQLARSVYDLITGTTSLTLVLLAALGLLAALTGLAVLVYCLLARLRAQDGIRFSQLAALVLMLTAASGMVQAFSGSNGNSSYVRNYVQALPRLPHAITPGLTLIIDQVRWGIWTHRESLAFEAMLVDAPADAGARPLPGLANIDVTLGFIESYGMSAIFDPRYAAVIRPRLEDMQQRLAGAGLHMVTGTINAPTFGGQSWLAHGTLLSGLWLNNQIRYQLLLASSRKTLIDDFHATGHTSVAVMPAIVGPWPEGLRFGYDRIFAAANIAYAGPPFNWVTMPDQFTWSFFENQVRAPTSQPVFAELALISSHAPWVPILPVIEDWTSIGDGSIFNQWQGAGEAPADLWRDHDRVRTQFALSVDYALAVATAYAERHVDDRHLLILLGDHQPAPLITGLDPSPGVPIHIISADPALLAPFARHGFRPGALPTDEYTDNSMSGFREWLHAAFGASAADQ